MNSEFDIKVRNAERCDANIMRWWSMNRPLDYRGMLLKAFDGIEANYIDDDVLKIAGFRP